MSSLSNEQRMRMEKNRKKALELKHLKQSQSHNISITGSNLVALNHFSSKPTTPQSPFLKAPTSSGSLASSEVRTATTTADEVKRIIEEKRKKALEIRAIKEQNCQGTNNDLKCPIVPIPSTNYPSFHSAISSTSVYDRYKDSPHSQNNQNGSSSIHSSKGLWSRIPETGLIASKDKLETKTLTVNEASKPRSHSDHSASIHPIMKTKACCTLISKSRFKVVVSRFHAKSIEVFKNMEDREFNHKTKTWSFPVGKHDALFFKITSSCPDIELEPLPKFVLRVAHEIRCKDEESINDLDLTPIGPELTAKIYGFQRMGIMAGIRNGGRILLADDMGLGKTVQAIGLAAYYRRDWPVLVVCPSSVRFQWNEAFCMWLPDLIMDLDTQVVLKGTDDISSKRKVVITSYDLLGKTAKSRHFGVIILDESHYIKNDKTIRAKTAIPICQQAKRVLLLSGTPALSRPKELFSQLHCLDPTMFKIHEFGVRYCDAKKNVFGWDYSGSSNMEELQILLEAHLMIRRKKSDVLDQLPEKRRQVVHLDAMLVKKNVKLNVIKHSLEKANQQKRKADAHNALLEFFHETAEAKVQAVCQYLTDRIEGLPKFLIFAHHRIVLDAISTLLTHLQVKSIRIDGLTSPVERQNLVQQFNADQDCKAAVLSIMAANAGLNMAAASCVIFAEIMWNPGIMVQAEDRVHRIGQRDSVMVQYLLAAGTSDDHVWDLLAQKLNVLGKVGLASASDESFKYADKQYQSNTWSDQPSISSFLCEIEDDEDLLQSVATQGGVTYIRDAETEKTGKLPCPENQISRTNQSHRDTKIPASIKSPFIKPPPQKNTLDRYFSPPKKPLNFSDDKSDGRGKDVLWATVGQCPKMESGKDTDLADEGFDWLDEDPFITDDNGNDKKRRLT